MEEPIFMKIIRREISAEILYEDGATLAILDVAPNNPGHTLVIPKEPARNIFDISEESWVAVMKVVRRLAPVVKEAMGAEGINIHMNNEAAAGQVVFHPHVHIIPRHSGDGFTHWHGAPYAKGEAAETAQKIRNALGR